MSPRLMAMQPDERLAQLVGDGDERAFEALVRRYRRPLAHYCRRLGCAESRREDVLQLAFLRAWLALERGDQVRDVRAWLYRIVHNTTLNAMQARAERSESFADLADVEALAGGGPEPDAALAVRSTLRDLAQLPALQREALLLSAVDGRRYDEVAEALGISEGAVRGLLHRARVALRSAAAALVPPQLLGWAGGVAGRTAPSAARLAEIVAPGATGDPIATVLKGAAVALSAAAVVTGVALGPLRRSQQDAGAHVASRHAQAPAVSLPQTTTADTATAAATRPGFEKRRAVASTGPATGVPSASAAPAPVSSTNRRTLTRAVSSPPQPQRATAPQGVSASAPGPTPTAPLPLTPTSSSGSSSPGQPAEGGAQPPHEEEAAGGTSSADDREGIAGKEGSGGEEREDSGESPPTAEEPSTAGEAQATQTHLDR